MHRQTVRTFYEVMDGAVKVLHTDPIFRPTAGARKNKGAGNGRGPRGRAGGR